MTMTKATEVAINSLGFAGLPQDTRVVVAMSGGVDSSVVAALLKEQGYDVIGITLQLYDHGVAIQKKGACCAGQDIHDARRVAEQIGIAHYVLDYENRFKATVMEEFVDSYLAGETPVPCIRCNERVKFKDMLETARDLGAHCMATGHYIQRLDGGSRAELHRAVDPDKDQSYFLFSTTQEQLDFLRFPLGSLTKSETRDLAARFGLQVAAKPESQDICFVPEGKYTGVIEKLRPGAAEPGDIVHLDGRVLGQHEGIINFTVGQRRGLKVAVGDPLYVVKLDPEARHVIVGPRQALLARHMRLREINWLGDQPLEEIGAAGLEIQVKVRSTTPPKSARLYLRQGTVEVELDEGEEGVSPGQACVFFEAGRDNGGPCARVLGGGWIAQADRV